jgi:hypothetical protein
MPVKPVRSLFVPAEYTYQGYDPIIISMVRKLPPGMIIEDIIGVQPMTEPIGAIFNTPWVINNKAR